MAKIRWLAISARMNYSMLLAAVKLCRFCMDYFQVLTGIFQC